VLDKGKPMSEHFIKNIEIKNFKCFKDFKANGFGRVNLIGGKNNVGKTAFMEALFVASDKNNLKQIIKSRYSSDIALMLCDEVGKKYIENFLNQKVEKLQNFSIKTNLVQFNTTYKSATKAHQKMFEDLYSKIIKNEHEDKLDLYLKYFDSYLEKFRMINGEPNCKKNNTFYNLNEFGDGLSHFIYFVMLLLANTNSIILIDEIENGIHYTNYDKLWELILKVSKEQNVQVFATTHSKEMIESYARVAKKLEDENIRFISLYKDKEDIKSIVFNNQEIEERLELRLDNR
jgi:AAA15 family ATPase/GTPase